MDADRSWFDKMVDYLTKFFGSVGFFVVNVIFFAVWMVVNRGVIPEVQVFDPFPHNLLTMVVSLEAIFLSIIVLMSQNRTSHVDDLREELDLRINIQAEEEITKILRMTNEIHGHLGLSSKLDKELKKMEQKTNVEKITQELAEEMK
jgi:uncharacterized membrane protein